MLTMSESNKKIKTSVKIAFAVDKSLSKLASSVLLIIHLLPRKCVQRAVFVQHVRTALSLQAGFWYLHQYFRSFIYRNEKTLLNRGMSAVATTCAANLLASHMPADRCCPLLTTACLLVTSGHIWPPRSTAGLAAEWRQLSRTQT
jgi:hypothetical protein